MRGWIDMAEAPAAPLPRISIGVTGHRRGHPAMAGRTAAVTAQLEALLSLVAAQVEIEAQDLGPLGQVRLHTLLADGADQCAAASAVARGWELAVPLPFGR